MCVCVCESSNTISIYIFQCVPPVSSTGRIRNYEFYKLFITHVIETPKLLNWPLPLLLLLPSLLLQCSAANLTADFSPSSKWNNESEFIKHCVGRRHFGPSSGTSVPHKLIKRRIASQLNKMRMRNLSTFKFITSKVVLSVPKSVFKWIIIKWYKI